jgi:ferredoxin
MLARGAQVAELMQIKEERGMAQNIKITVDHNRCVGNAMCEQYAPNTFGLNEERQSYVKDPAGDPVELVIEAATNCPVSAIKVEDADTGEVLFVEENF